ncbi:hypothetical protein [Atlantibacter sp.]|uniref:hypothetical protein n=1 Tax=Atlantibacter sp. TaxID=1903473 RepID=UPI0028A77C69|nr:hypothetical protein [Atlantibacter sp.]
MAIYFFYSKAGNVIAVEKGALIHEQWLKQGYQKEFEEVEAATSQAALARFHDIRAEQEKNLWAFTTGPILFSLLALLAYLFFA